MAKEYTAFTIRAKNGVFKEIKIPVQVLTSSAEQKIIGTPIKIGSAMALWDTGATMSGITKRLANMLGLEPFSMTSITTAGGVVSDVPVYKIDFILSNENSFGFPNNVSLDVENNVHFFNINVTELPNNNSFDFLVGMDVITLGDFSITNKNSCSCVSFRIPPDPLFYIDYVTCQKKNKKGKNQKNQLRRKQAR